MSIPTGTSTCCRHYISLWTKKKKNGDTGNHQNLPPTRVVGYLFSSQGFLVPYINTGTVQEISEISCIGSDIPVQGTAIRFVHSTHGVYSDSKGGETDGHPQGYKNPPVPRPLVGESQVPPSLSPAYTGFSENVPGPRLAGNFGQSELEPKQVFDLVGYQFDLQTIIQTLLSLPACPVRQFISLIGLLTATEQQVHLGQLHMRPIQWHL